jgi:hypothetical protein
VGGVAHARSRGGVACAIETSDWIAASADTLLVGDRDRDQGLSTFCRGERLRLGLVREEGGGVVEHVRPGGQ